MAKDLIFVEIEGREYPICATIEAMSLLSDKYESYEGWNNSLASETVTREQMEAVKYGVFVFISEGCAKARILERKRRDGTEYEPIPLDKIGRMIDFNNLADIVNKMMDAVLIGRTVEVEVEEPKNA